jgi:hypothetical protein
LRLDDAAEQFANEGFTKLLLARETTDHNRYANEFMTGNYIKERLCELGVLDSMHIEQTRQVGRTPEFNTMNIRNLKPFIESYPEGSTIAIVYVTRGLPWNKDETLISDPFATSHPWTKEVYHENAYLNYLSLKKALQETFGTRYNLVFTKGGINSDLRADNFFAYAVNKKNENGGVFIRVRDAINTLKAEGRDKIVVAMCHWNYDNIDTILTNKLNNSLPITPKLDIQAGNYASTHCEGASSPTVVSCDSPSAVAKITVAPSYNNFPEEFATAYYVVLRGTLERFGLYPNGETIAMEASQPITKLDGGTVEVTSAASQIKGAKIVIPGDPYPDRPESFYYYLIPPDYSSANTNAIPINDPADTNDCMWEDTTISIGQRTNPPAINIAYSAGPAVFFGPYRTLFNRNVTITIPYTAVVGPASLKPYIYNHVTNDWDAIAGAVIDETNHLITFTTNVLGLYQVGSTTPTTTTSVPTTAIDLLYFKAEAGSNSVRLSWATETEIKNAGFNIHRADKKNGDYIQLNEALIPAAGSPTQGASYEYIDTSVQNGKKYWYKLQDVELGGMTEDHGPVRVTPRRIFGIFKK